MRKTTLLHFNDVVLHAKSQEQLLIAALSDVVKSGIFLNGRQNIKLRLNLAGYLGAKYVHALASGHDALLLGLLALHLSKKDEVIVPANAYPTAFPVYLSGAKMVLCDVDANGQLDIHCLKKAINPRTKAIVLVHMFGLTGPVEEVAALAKKHDLTLIEDCAQAFGTKYKDRYVGTFGDIGCFSFYPTKNLGTHGDGGALITKSSSVYERVSMAKAYGEKLRYYSMFVSGHSRLPELQAAILNTYFKTIRSSFVKRQKMYDYFAQCITGLRLDGLRCLASYTSSSPVPHLFVIECQHSTGLYKYLGLNHIEAHRHYPSPVHLIPAFKSLGYKQGDFPVAERLSRSCLSLPFHSYITKKQIDTIVRLIKRFYDKKNTR